MLKLFTILSAMLVSACALQSQTLIDEAHEVFEGVNEIEVNGKFSAVEVTGREQATVALDGEIKSSRSANYAIRYDRDGDKLKVWIEGSSSSWGRTEGILRLVVPQRCNVFVDNGSGSVKASNLKYGGLVIKNGSGSVSLRNTLSNAKISAASGSVQAEDHEGNIEAASSSGSVKLNDIRGNVIAKTASGSVNLESVEGDVTANTASGSIRINDAAGAMDLKSASGSIKGSEIMLTGNSSFSSSSGSIHMDLLNGENQLSYDLSSGSGSINLNDNRKSKNFVKQNGGINITGKSASGSQTYRSKSAI